MTSLKTNKRHHKKSELLRFLAVLAVVVAYAAYTMYSYGVEKGLAVTGLTWAFFVFATPIADGGFVVAFPVRLITGFRMLHTQIIVWIFGALLVGTYLIASPDTYQATPLLQLFYEILVTPWPLGIILVLSAIGTFVSIKFDDEVVDVVGQKLKKTKQTNTRTKLLMNVGIFAVTVVLYVVLLQVTGTDIAFM